MLILMMSQGGSFKEGALVGLFGVATADVEDEVGGGRGWMGGSKGRPSRLLGVFGDGAEVVLDGVLVLLGRVLSPLLHEFVAKFGGEGVPV